jgi:hypothetical integral membrane protein (TIGR02206 family)
MVEEGRMAQYFSLDFKGEPFVMFGPPHLVVLAILLVVNLSLVRLRGRPTATRVVRLGLAWALVINELAWHVWNAAVGRWTIQEMLPLHLCSVLVWTTALMLFTENYRIYEFIYLMGIGGAVQAVFTPDIGRYGFPHFRFFQTFISHGGIITAAIFMTVVQGLRPYWRSLLRVFVVMNVYLVVVFAINSLIGSNYLFIMHPPDTPSLIDMLGPWPWYILALEALGMLTCLILYLPFAFKDWLARPATQPVV